MSPPSESQGRIQHRQTDTLFTFQCDRGVLVPPLPNQEITRVVLAALIGKATAQHQRHLAATMGMLGDATTFGDALQRKFVTGVAGFEITDTQGLCDTLPHQIGVIAVDQAV